MDIVDLALRVRSTLNTEAAIVDAASTVIDVVKGNAQGQDVPFVRFEQHASGTFPGYDPFQGQNRLFTVVLEHSTGLGVFYPPRTTTAANSAYINYIKHRLFDITRLGCWTDYIARGLPATLSGDPPAMPDDVLIPPFVITGHEGTPTPVSTMTSTVSTPTPTTTATPRVPEAWRVFIPMARR